MAKLRIKELAQARNVSQTQLQIVSGVTMPLLRRYWHNRTKSIELQPLEKIAKALGVRSGELLVDDDEAATT